MNDYLAIELAIELHHFAKWMLLTVSSGEDYDVAWEYYWETLEALV
jgi:hypothetical protein